MRTQSITPSFSGKFVIPNNKENKQVNYLYNKVSKIVKDNNITGEFHNDKIVLTTDKTQEKNLFNALKEFGIKIFSLNERK